MYALVPSTQITGLEPSSAFLFKSALYPCVIEFMVKRDTNSGSSSTAKAAAAAAGSAGRTTSNDGAGGVLGAAGTGITDAAGGGGEADGHEKDDTVTAAAAAATGEAGGSGRASGAGEGESSSSSSSWLGQAKPKETSYKVRTFDNQRLEIRTSKFVGEATLACRRKHRARTANSRRRAGIVASWC